MVHEGKEHPLDRSEDEYALSKQDSNTPLADEWKPEGRKTSLIYPFISNIAKHHHHHLNNRRLNDDGGGGDVKDDSCKGLLDGLRVVGGPGGLLARDNVVVPTCTNCTGGRLVSCRKVSGWGSTLCWSRRPSLMTIVLLLFVFAVSLIGTVLVCFTNVLNSTLLMNMVIKYNSTAYDMWRDPPVHPLVKIHVMNYTNVKDVESGKAKKFIVQDIGPYVYRETISRVNVKFNDNGTITFQEKKTHQFLPKLSVGSQFDNVTVPNLPLLSAISMLQDSYYFTKVGASTLFKTLNTKAFRSLPLHRFLWGYDDDLITLAQPYLTLKGELPYKQFGVLVTRNGVSRDKITIHTGENGLSQLGVIDRYNGENRIHHWGTDECNRVDATDGTIFPASMIDGKQPLYVYNRDLCRRFPFVFKEKIKVFQGIQAWRYSPPREVFDHPSTNPSNQCYCHMDSGVCPPKGVFNSSPCAYGAPAFASFPHFYLGDPALLDTIEGLHPDPEKHNSFIDIHPGLGFPVAGSTKMQINIQVRKSDGISGYDYLENNLLLPVVWIDMTVLELPEAVKALVYHGTFSVQQLKLALTWSCSIVLAISSICLLLSLRTWWITRNVKF